MLCSGHQSRLMNRISAPIAVAVALCCALLVLFAPAARAQTIRNTAYAHWLFQGEMIRASSNEVSFDVAQVPVSLNTFVASASVSDALSFSPSSCGGQVLSVPGLTGTTAVASVAQTTKLHIGDVFYFKLVASQANKDPDAIDSVQTELVTNSGDLETITIYETAPNSGVFIGAVPTTAIPPDAKSGDCRLSVAAGDVISIDCMISGKVTPIATAQLDVLADPFGLVFDSEDGTPVDGAKVTLINTATGAPAQVKAPDGVTDWPSTVTTGSPVTDSAGIIHQLPVGEYWFPLVRTGTYRIVVDPPLPYRAPSNLSQAAVAGLTRPDGVPVKLDPASFGGTLTISTPDAVRVDIPVDRPPIAVSVTKTVSRASAQPGDLVFYTVTVQNTDPGHVKRDVVVVDTGAPELRLRTSSVRVGGIAHPELVTPAADGHGLTVRLGTLAPGATRLITYAMTVSARAPPGQVVNKVEATDARGLTGFASAVLRVEQDGLTARMTLIGRVTGGGCVAHGPHPGIPGVRVMLEDGSFAVTDRDGRYHFEGLVPGDHVVQAMVTTLPEGAEFTTCGGSTRQARSAISRFVSGEGGSLAVANFRATGVALPMPGMPPMQIPGMPPPPGAATPATPANGEVSDRTAAGGDTDWLALGDGPTGFLFPAPDYNPRAPAIRVAIRHRAGQKVELLLDGKPVEKVSSDGSKTSASRTWAVSLWRGLPLERETTLITAVVRNADGSEATRLTREVHFNQTPAQVELVPGKTHLVADGRTRPVLAMRILDRNGRPVHAGLSGEFALGAPYESAEALDAMQSRALSGLGRQAPHWTVRGDDGIALVELAPTMVSGALNLDFTFGDRDQQRHQTLETWVVPGDLKWTLVGLAEGSVGSRSIADVMERTGRFDSDLGDHARVAFYAKGRVLGRFLLTVAYDSAKQKDDQRLLGAIDPKAYYTVFADGSTRRFDAASREKLYVRIEARAFTALFGDYDTGFTQTQLARYQRVLTGVKAEGTFGHLHVQTFGAKVSSTHHRVEIQGGGLSGPYALGSKTIVANSETVVLETRDRLRSEVIVSHTPLTRFIDYDVDLLSGTITFKQPILSRDVDFNPQFIVVDYDTDAALGAGGAINAGMRADWTTRDHRLRVGATVISDKGDAARTTVGALDVKAKIGASTELRAEAAVSRAAETKTAWLVEAEHHDRKLDVLAYARSVEAGYGVGQMNGAESGRRKLGADARVRLNQSFSVSASTWYDASLTDDSWREALQIKGEYRSKTLDARLGVSALRDHLADGRDAASTTLDAGVTRHMLNNRLQIDASSSFGLGKTESLDLPSRYTLAARYALNSKVKLLGTYEIAKGSAIDARTARVGFEAQPWRGAKVTSSVGQQNIQEYGARSFAAFGLNQSLDLGKHVTVDATLDANKVLGGFDLSKVVNPAQPVASGGQLNGGGTLTENFTALTLGATWRRALWTVTVRGELRQGELARRKGVTFGAIRQLGEGRVVGAGASWTNADGSDGSRSSVFDGALALAWRPAESNFAFLSKLEYRADRTVAATASGAGIGAASVAGVAGTAGTTAFNEVGNSFGNAHARRLIGSVSANWSPRTRFTDENGEVQTTQRSEIGLFAAVRHNLDAYDGFNLAGTTLMGGIDAHIGIGPNVEIGGSATVRTNVTDHTTDFAIGPKIGFVPAKDVELSVGYNVTGFRDRDFAAARSTNRGVFATLKAKFDSGTFSFLGLH